MIDANSQFFAILTNVGMAKQANADALGLPWKFTEMGVGDANNTDPIPSATQTHLINEWRRRPLNQVRVDPVNPAVIIAEQIIPADEGGHWIREIGLYDADGDLVAVANCAPSFKPVLSQGSGRTQVVRMNFIVSSTGNITLKIDPSVVLATREYVDNKILEELYKLDSKQSVLVATTANIALAGLQVIDGVSVPAGARVLVKNQAVAKDNGIWIAAAPVWTRATDADTNAEVTSALVVSVEQGATLADSRWQLVTDGVIVLGATALTFQDVTQGYAPINSPAFLGAPTALTPPQFDNSLRLVNTTFLKRTGVEFSNLNSVGVSTVLTNSSIGSVVSASAATPINMTLPPTAGVPPGATIEVANAGGGGVVTILASGSDVLTSQGGVVVPIVLGAGDNAYFIKVTGEWRLRGGSISLKYAAALVASELNQGTAKIATQTLTDAGVDDATIVTPKKMRWGFSILKAANGYIVFPSWLGGFIIQWVGVAMPTTQGGSTNFSWPLAFPAASVACAFATNHTVSTAGYNCLSVASRTLTGAQLLNVGLSGALGSVAAATVIGLGW